MTNSVEQNLLHASGLNLGVVENAIGSILTFQNDFADLYFQSSEHESWVLEDGIIKEGSYNIERALG